MSQDFTWQHTDGNRGAKNQAGLLMKTRRKRDAGILGDCSPGLKESNNPLRWPLSDATINAAHGVTRFGVYIGLGIEQRPHHLMVTLLVTPWINVNAVTPVLASAR